MMIENGSDSLKQSWGLSLGSSSWAAQCVDTESFTDLRSVDSSLHGTPSVLLPRLSGEPIRLDIWGPAHPRGSGEPWPHEAVVNKQVGSGRMPLSAAWTARNQRDLATDNLEHRDHTWRWQMDGVSRELEASMAIAEALAQLSHRISPESSIAVTIPNNFRQQEQQLLIDLCRTRGTKITLLWSPVAAALAWLDRYENTLETLLEFRRTLLHVHLDWGTTQFTELKIVRCDNPSSRKWLPARTRPKKENLLSGFGWLAEAASLNSASINSRWQTHLKGANVDGFRHKDTQETIINALQGWEVAESDPGDHFDAFVDGLIKNQNKYAGVVITGDFAGFKFEGSTTLESVLDVYGVNIAESSIVAPGLEGERLLAKGAAIFSSHRERDVVTYLDTLPELDLFVETTGQFDWLPLLGQENEFVPGGQIWQREQPIRGLSVRRGATSLRLVVAHEEFGGVREIAAQLSETAEQRLSAELHVSAVAAQGNAMLRLRLFDESKFYHSEILADWRRMKPILDKNDDPIGKDDYLEDQPRAFPEITPRLSSLNNWKRALPSIQMLIERAQSESKDLSRLANDEYFLREINAAVQQKDQYQYPNDATAIGSDYTCPGAQSDLEEFAQQMLKLFRYCVKKNATGISQTIRILGYISVNDAYFEDWLIKNLSPKFQDGGAVKHSFGLCARRPSNISEFMGYQFKLGGPMPRTNDMKAVSQILRYRANATEKLTPILANRALETSIEVFRKELFAGGGSYNFRWSSLIIVYLLRRRMFDSEFADPAGQLAMKAKELFEQAIDSCRSGMVRPLGGSVDVPAALQQMIDYIDKKGRGDILMSND